MDMLILENTKDGEWSYCFEATVGKKSGWVSYWQSEYSKSVTVCCKNASHKVWRGTGKTYFGDNCFDAAKQACKSVEMRSIVEEAQRQVSQNF